MGEADRFLEGEYQLDLTFYRCGWEFHHQGMAIHLENIDGLGASVEVLGDQDDKVNSLLAKLNLTDTTNHSVPKLVELME